MNVNAIKLVVICSICSICSCKKSRQLIAIKRSQKEWLVIQPELEDPNLDNGETLCRECHKKEHSNWGSHYVK